MPRTRTSSAAELLVELRRDDPLPLHRQLERELRGAIRSGRLAPRSALPSTRALAEQLGLSRGVVVEAYEQLDAEGKEIDFYVILETDPGLQNNREKALDLLSQVADGYQKAEKTYGEAQDIADSHPKLIKAN